MTNGKTSFAIFFKRKREEVGLTQQELSTQTEIPKSTISGIETGRFLPSEETIDAVADVLQVSREELLKEKENNVEAPLVSQRVAKKGTTTLEDGIDSETAIVNGIDPVEFDDFGRLMTDTNTSRIKKQLILIDYFNQLNEVNQTQLIEISQVLLSNQSNKWDKKRRCSHLARSNEQRLSSRNCRSLESNYLIFYSIKKEVTEYGKETS